MKDKQAAERANVSADISARHFEDWYEKAKGEISQWKTFYQCEAAWNAALSQQAGQAVTLTDAERDAARWRAHFELMRTETTERQLRDYLEAVDAKAALLAKAAPVADLARAIHYPDCWDTAAYPTLASALSETAAEFRCTNDDCAAPVAAAPVAAEPAKTCWKCGHAEHLDSCVNVAPSEAPVAAEPVAWAVECTHDGKRVKQEVYLREDRAREMADPKKWTKGSEPRVVLLYATPPASEADRQRRSYDDSTVEALERYCGRLQERLNKVKGQSAARYSAPDSPYPTDDAALGAILDVSRGYIKEPGMRTIFELAQVIASRPSRASSSRAAVEIPDGYALVPKEPTGMMKDAGANALPINAARPWIASACYRTMLAAAEAPKENGA